MTQECACACSWLAENTPHYYSRGVEAVGPVLEDGKERVKVAIAFVAQKSSQLLLWLQENLPRLIQWVSNTHTLLF